MAETGRLLDKCRPYEVCVPLSAQQISKDFADRLPAGVMVGDVGICTAPLLGGLLLPNATFVEPPMYVSHVSLLLLIGLIALHV